MSTTAATEYRITLPFPPSVNGLKGPVDARAIGQITGNVRVDPATGCWNWKLSKTKEGYGRVWLRAKRYLAHRLSHLLFVGEIPTGKCVMHTCDNRSCCNPDHLTVGSHQDNMADMVAKSRQAVGEVNGLSKISANDAKEIRCVYARGEGTLAEVGARFGISAENTGAIVRGRTWRHAGGPLTFARGRGQR